MGYFQRIYDAAKQKNEQVLRELFAQGACIDERENSTLFTSPAGKLAREGDVESAYFLINRFGAGIEFVVDGLLKGGLQAEANALMQQYNLKTDDSCFCVLNDQSGRYRQAAYPSENQQINQNNIQAAIVAGNIEQVRALENRRHKKEKQFMEYAAHGGHLYLVEKMYKQGYSLPKDISYWLGFMEHAWFPIGYPSARFKSKELALHSLSFISNTSFLDRLAFKATEDYSGIDYNIIEVTQQAKEIHALMTSRNMGYEEALAECSAPIDNPVLEIKYGVFFKRTRAIVKNADGKNSGIVDSYEGCSIM